MIIGITNLPCSGADSIGDYLVKEKGFIWLSYSDLLREELRARGEEITRKSMQDLGNELRGKYGGGELSKRLLLKVEPGKNYVFGTIRNPLEAVELKKFKDSFLIAVKADFEKRFEWVVKRNREVDAKTLQDLKELDEMECGKGQPEHGMFIADCMNMADYVIKNNSTKEKLYRKVDEILDKMKEKTKFI